MPCSGIKITVRAILLLFLAGCDTAADMVGGDDAAPWETVDAYFYPDRSNLEKFERQDGLESVDACKMWVNAAAARANDSSIRRGDYQCGVGESDSLAGMKIYRVVVK